LEMDGIGALSLDDLRSTFGVPGQTFWDLLSCERSDRQEQLYFAGELPLEKTPLIRFEAQRAAFVSPHGLFVAILGHLEETLFNGEAAEKRRQARDRRLEDETAEVFSRLLPSASQFRNLFESSDCQ